jgi:hypothetical protein
LDRLALSFHREAEAEHAVGTRCHIESYLSFAFDLNEAQHLEMSVSETA